MTARPLLLWQDGGEDVRREVLPQLFRELRGTVDDGLDVVFFRDHMHPPIVTGTQSQLPRYRMSARAKKELVIFFGLTLAIMYLLCFAVVLFLTPMKVFADRHLGGLDPQLLLYVAAYSPTLVAIALTARYEGKAGLRSLITNVFRWRVGFKAWLLAFFMLPAIWLLVAIIRHWTVNAPVHWSSWFVTFPQLLFSFYLFTDTGGLGEEIGWRGYAMPRLLGGLTPTGAGLVVGFLFGLWHLPGWFLTGLGGHFAQLDFANFLGSTMILSVLMAYLYLRAHGSVLLAGVIPHMIANIGSPDEAAFYSQNWEYLGYLSLFTLVLITVESRRMFVRPPFDAEISSPTFTRIE